MHSTPVHEQCNTLRYAVLMMRSRSHRRNNICRAGSIGQQGKAPSTTLSPHRHEPCHFPEDKAFAVRALGELLAKTFRDGDVNTSRVLSIDAAKFLTPAGCKNFVAGTSPRSKRGMVVYKFPRKPVPGEIACSAKWRQTGVR